MYYNPYTFRWEGNENDLTPFDAPASSPSTTSIPPHMLREKLDTTNTHSHTSQYREKENTTPRPALIQNVNSSMNVQVVGGMVFDPQKMCWLKMPASATSARNRSSSRSANARNSETGDTMDGFDALDAFDDDEEEDVFKDVPDLEDGVSKEAEKVSGRKSDVGSALKDEWLVGEEFDVGPEFVRRQREEEERWRRKCERWVGDSVLRGGEDWRWSIRDVVKE